MANGTELFKEKAIDMGILKHLLTPYKDGSLGNWTGVDVAVRESNALKEKIRALMVLREKEVDAIVTKYGGPITQLQDVKDSVDGMVEGFCDAHTTELNFVPRGDHEEVAMRQLLNCTLTIIKESKTRIKVSHDKPAPQAA